MDAFVKQYLDNPFILGGVVAVLVGLLTAFYFTRRQALRQNDDWIIDDHLAAGRYVEAAAVAQSAGKFREAIDYYLRAQQPVRAAQLAARTGNSRSAAELYERAGETERAAYYFRQAGMPNKADELTASVPPGQRSVRPVAPDVDLPSIGPSAPEPASEEGSAVERFHQARANGKSDVASRARLQELAQDAADELMDRGDIREAAEIYRDAGLDEEAIHLYANVLGSPGEAAPLLAAQGKHERAAEMYELAGQQERAAKLWVQVANAAPDPLEYVDRIEGASVETAVTFLQHLAEGTPLREETAELHYRYGCVLEKGGHEEHAIQIFVTLSELLGDYKDVRSRLGTLRSPKAPPGVRAAPRTSSPSPGAPAFPSGHPGAPAYPSTPPGGAEAFPSMNPEARVSLPKIQVEQISAIARQAAQHAIEQAARSRSFQPIKVEEDEPSRHPSGARRARGKTARVTVGIIDAAISVDELVDSPVRQARDGPTIQSLQEWTRAGKCSLQNIEVYYRLGLAYLAAGQWGEARRAFRDVDDVSPGYRDAERRALQIEKWTRAVDSKMATSNTRSQLAGPGGVDSTGRYKIVGELGRGGMAVVYRATDTVLGRDVALKFITDEFRGRKEFLELFQREARSAAKLNHPNIVTIYDFGVLDGRPFLSMEYVDGTTAEQMIDQRGELTTVEALVMAREVLRALHYAHKEHIVHRDIKPSNMMRASNGSIKLMDFGLAKSVEKDARSSIVAGTPAYMPPEQAIGGDVDHRADLFAVGASLYEMLVGRVPYTSAERSVAPPLLRSIKPDLPEALDSIVAKALAFDPAKRYQSAKEFGMPLKRILDAVEAFHRRVLEHEQASGNANGAPGRGPPQPSVARVLGAESPKSLAPRAFARTKVSSGD